MFKKSFILFSDIKEEVTLTSTKASTVHPLSLTIENTPLLSLEELNIYFYISSTSNLVEEMFNSLELILKEERFQSSSTHYLLVPYFLSSSENIYSNPQKSLVIDNLIKEELEIKLSAWMTATKDQLISLSTKAFSSLLTKAKAKRPKPSLTSLPSTPS
jgi:predicted ferric reductase